MGFISGGMALAAGLGIYGAARGVSSIKRSIRKSMQIPRVARQELPPTPAPTPPVELQPPKIGHEKAQDAGRKARNMDKKRLIRGRGRASNILTIDQNKKQDEQEVNLAKRLLGG